MKAASAPRSTDLEALLERLGRVARRVARLRGQRVAAALELLLRLERELARAGLQLPLGQRLAVDLEGHGGGLVEAHRDPDLAAREADALQLALGRGRVLLRR